MTIHQLFFSFKEAVQNIVRSFGSSAYTSTRTTTTSTTYSNIASVTTSEASGDRLAVFWQCIGDMNNTTYSVRVMLGEGSTQRVLYTLEPQDTTDRFSMGGVYAYSGGSNRTWNIRHSTSNSSGTAGRANFQISYLKLLSTDLFSYTSALSSTSSTTFQTKESIFVTNTGSYIVVACAVATPSAAGASQNIRLFNNGNSYGSLGNIYAQDTANLVPYFHVERVNVTTSGPFTIEFNSNGSAVLGVRESTLLLLRESDFENVYYANENTQQDTTANNYVDGLTQTFNIQNPSNQHLIIASAMIESNSTSDSAFIRLFNKSTSLDYSGVQLREDNNTAEWHPTMCTRVVTFTQSTNEIAWQFYSEGSNTASIKNMSIVILDLGTT